MDEASNIIALRPAKAKRGGGAPIAEPVTVTPFGTIESLCAEFEAAIDEREGAFRRLSYTTPDGKRCCGDPEYFRIAEACERRMDALTLRIARMEARTPYELKLKARLCVRYNCVLLGSPDEPAGAILESLYRDLGADA